MLVCACGRWMHTEGVEEAPHENPEHWMVRSECLGCGLWVGLEGPKKDVASLVDRIMWSDDARHVLNRKPPYIAKLFKEEVEDYTRTVGQRVITFDLLAQAKQGGAVEWDPDAEARLSNIPGPIRAMAKIELERTAAEHGDGRVTIALMEEVKARYFGMAAPKGQEGQL